jgi:broad specificity phosphatase PhoE
MMVPMGELILLRHGETEWSRDGQHTGRTDVPLTAAGEAAAAALKPVLARRDICAAFTSPLRRATRTAELAGLAGAQQDPDLQEWDYGGYEGQTTLQIRTHQPGWYLWRDGVIPGDTEHPGETVQQVGARADAALARVTPLLADGDVVLVSHGHLLRVLAARWLRLDPAGGRLFRLGTGTLCTLGTEHGEPVITSWNVPIP